MKQPAATTPSSLTDESSGSREPIAVRLLGPVQVVVDGAPVPLSSPKLRRLLTVLALSHNRVVSSARLIDQLWGEDPPASAMSALQVHISRLRRALGGSSGTARVRLGRRPPGYLLTVPEDAVDVRRFARLVAAARQQIQLDPAPALDLVDEALALVVGEPLADVVDELDPLAADAHRLRETVLAAQELRIDALQGTGRFAEATLLTGALVTSYPLRESVRTQQMLALYRSGRSADALEAYEAFRRLLAADLGADPGPQLRRLHSQILQQDPCLDGPASVRLDLASTPAALVGRRAVVSRIDQALTQLTEGSGGVWTLSGEAGIGKTRLAEELSRRARGRDLTVVWGRGEEGAGDAPYRAWSQVLRALPEVSVTTPVLDGDGGRSAGSSDPAVRRHVHDTVAAALVGQGQRRPMVVVLEDVQWFDEWSLELLLAVARLVPGAPLLLALTLRQDSQSPAGVGELMAQLARLPASHQVRVSGLPQDEAAELVATVAGLARGERPDWLVGAVARADGNPFFLTELTRLVRDQWRELDSGTPAGLPLSIRDVLLRRLLPLSVEARQLLEVAAVIGREAPHGVLEHVLGWPADQLDRAIAEVSEAGLVREELHSQLSIRFSHALVRELLVEELRPVVRARRHAQVGVAVAALPGRVDIDRVLAHLSAGASTIPAARLQAILLDAARRASGQAAYEDAERLLRRAVELAGELPEGPERDALQPQAQARLASAIAEQQGMA